MFKFPYSSIICKFGLQEKGFQMKQMGYLNDVTCQNEISKKDQGNGVFQESILH